jgi:superfamily II DNA/RNA helicase
VDEYTAALELEQLRAEITALKELGEQARRVRDAGHDSKLAALRECLNKSQFDELKDGRGKLLIFTEHRDTLTYLREHLERWGYSTCEIHGGMNPHERKRAQEEFRTGRQICIATEAAGEGINLQFCRLMLNSRAISLLLAPRAMSCKIDISRTDKGANISFGLSSNTASSSNFMSTT